MYVILTLAPDDDFCMMLSYRCTKRGCSHDYFSLVMDVMLILCRLSSMLIPLVQEEECSLYSVSAQAHTHTQPHMHNTNNTYILPVSKDVACIYAT